MERIKKIQLLLDMQEHPEQYSEQALKAMLDDPEVCELMEATAALKQAMMAEDDKVNKYDVDAEWQKFKVGHVISPPTGGVLREAKRQSRARGGHYKSLPSMGVTSPVPSCRRGIRYQVAASIIGVLMVSSIAFAAIHIARQIQKPTDDMAADTVAVANSSLFILHSSLPEDSIPSSVVRYDEATLEQILTDMAAYYGLTLNWKSEDAKTLRLFYIWNKQQSAAEAISNMNSFERIRLELSDSVLTADIQTNSPKQ